MKTSLTISDIFEAIDKTEYVVLAGTTTTTTVCVLTLVNGFVVTGTSPCVDPGKFNQAEGVKYAFEKATDEVWKLEGYLLRQRLYEVEKLQQVRVPHFAPDKWSHYPPDTPKGDGPYG